MVDDNLEDLTQEQVDEREAKALAEVARIQSFKEGVRLARHQQHVKEVKDLVEKYGLNVADVFPHMRLENVAPVVSAPVAGGAKRGRKDGDKQGPATVKFQNASGQSWKGRGLPAAWLLEHTKGGGKLLDLAAPGLAWNGEMTRDTKTKTNRPPTWVQMLMDEGVTQEQLKAGLNKPA
jgi:DNA-binding protein H-NS